MIECGACRRHHRLDAPQCPFCGGPPPTPAWFAAFGAALTTVLLSACYGMPTTKFTDTYPTDVDLPPTTLTEATGDTGDTAVVIAVTGSTGATGDTGATGATGDTAAPDTADTAGTTGDTGLSTP